MESWRPIKDFEGIYEISDQGKVKRLCQNGKHRILKAVGRKGNGGYEARVSLYKNGERKNAMIARLVYETFIGPVPEGNIITHRNGLRMDNDLRNLEMVTVSEHFQRLGGGGKRRPVIKLDKSGNIVDVYPSCRACGEAEGYSYASISLRCMDKSKEKWDYDFAYEDDVKSINAALRRLGVNKRPSWYK